MRGLPEWPDGPLSLVRDPLPRATVSARLTRLSSRLSRQQTHEERGDVTQGNFEPARKRFVDEVRAAWHAFLEDKNTINQAGEVAPRDDRLDRVLEEHAEATLRGSIAEAWKEYERATNRSTDETSDLRTV
jgi:hypothetical protein